MKILHVIRHEDDRRALLTAREQAREHNVTTVLLHDAVLSEAYLEGDVYAMESDWEARGKRKPYRTLDYDGLVRMVFEYDRVIVW